MVVGNIRIIPTQYVVHGHLNDTRMEGRGGRGVNFADQ